MTRTLRTTFVFALLVALAIPALAQRARPYHGDNTLRVRLGLFEPDGESVYWDDKALDFTGSSEDFEDALVGVEYVRHLGDRWGLLFAASGYEGQEDQAYLDFVDGAGNDIFHTTTLDISSLTAGLVFYLRDPGRRRLAPYVGAGGGLYSWDLEEAGDFIDFTTAPLEIFTTRFQDDGNTLGWYWHAGLQVGLTPTWSFFAESRWHRAEDDLSQDFEGFGELDLSGREISGGFAWRF